MWDILVVDNFLDVREHALAQEYTDYVGLDGVTYKGSCVVEVPGLLDKLEQIVGPVDMLGMGYRLALEGELPNQSIHTDLGWGTHALVLYLNEDPVDTGTAFWQHTETRVNELQPEQIAEYESIKESLDKRDDWWIMRCVWSRYGRCVIFPSSRFHSRWPFEGFGTDKYTGRLIAVAFFTPKEKGSD